MRKKVFFKSKDWEKRTKSGQFRTMKNSLLEYSQKKILFYHAHQLLIPLYSNTNANSTLMIDQKESSTIII